jgi:hypothetical protein
VDASNCLTPAGICQVGDCKRLPCFRVKLDAAAGAQRVCRSAGACANHLGVLVQDLAAWARNRGLHEGQLIVLAIDPHASPDLSLSNIQVGDGFAFTAIKLRRI